MAERWQARAMHTWERWRATAVHLEVGGHAVATYERGDPEGTPFTFLHGYPSSSLDLAPVLDHLGDGWRALTLDLPGFGASESTPGEPPTVAGAADAVEALWADRGVTSTVLVAHDYGATVGQELVARHADGTLPVALTAVLWMNGGLYPDLHRPTAGQQLLLDPEHGAEVAAAITRETFVDAIVATWGTRVPPDRDALAQMHAALADGGGDVLMHELISYVPQRVRFADRWAAALTTDLPTTYVWGDADPVSGAHMIEGVQQRAGGTPRIVRMADVGHWPPLEAPDVVAAEIRALDP